MCEDCLAECLSECLAECCACTLTAAGKGLTWLCSALAEACCPPDVGTEAFDLGIAAGAGAAIATAQKGNTDEKSSLLPKDAQKQNDNATSNTSTTGAPSGFFPSNNSLPDELPSARYTPPTGENATKNAAPTQSVML